MMLDPLSIIFVFQLLAETSNARFYELRLTHELTNPRVGVIPSLFLRI